jgi:hypothetical protein
MTNTRELSKLLIGKLEDLLAKLPADAPVPDNTALALLIGTDRTWFNKNAKAVQILREAREAHGSARKMVGAREPGAVAEKPERSKQLDRLMAELGKKDEKIAELSAALEAVKAENRRLKHMEAQALENGRRLTGLP